MPTRRWSWTCLLLTLLVGLSACQTTDTGDQTLAGAARAVPIDHLIVIFLENRSFDHLYGGFPGARGLDRPEAAIPQTDRDGRPYATLPPVVERKTNAIDPRFPAALLNAPFLIDRFAPASEKTPNPVHRFYQHILQIDGGRMDRYVAWSGTGGLPMGHYETAKLPLYPYARQYALADSYFTAAFGGSWLNHMWLICACTAVFPDAPADMRAEPTFDAAGHLVGLARDGDVTPDGFAVNDLEPFARPYLPGTPPGRRVPPQTMATIGDRLSAAGVSWAWYAGGWNAALAGHADPLFEFHHQPFVYFAAYAEGTAARARHLKDETDFTRSLGDGTLPAVSYIKPIGEVDSHPGYSTVWAGETHAVQLIEAVKRSPYWKRSVVIVTYDDFGGWYDHVPPATVDRWGPGGRVPALIISPWAKKGFVDSTRYDHTSILRFIERRWDLAPLASRDAAARNMLDAFDFSQRE